MDATITAIHFIIALFANYLLWHFAWKPYLIDKYKARVFTLRNKLFDYAAEGNIDFNSKAYRSLRDLMNSSLRFAHRYSISHIVAVRLFMPEVQKHGERLDREIRDGINNVDDEEIRNTLLFFLKRLEYENGLQLIRINPGMLVLFYGIGVPYILIKDMTQSFSSSNASKRAARRVGREIEGQIDYADASTVVHQNGNDKVGRELEMV